MRRTLPFPLTLLIAAGACGQAEVVVMIEIDVANAEGDGTVPLALADVEVQLLPYDRDAIFDSITAVFPRPEPQIPPDLLAAREELQVLQATWDAAQRRWGMIRDTLGKINAAMEEYSRAEAQYTILFLEYGDFESQLEGATRDNDAAFEAFDRLQQGTIKAADSVRLLQDSWADDAFAEVGTIFLTLQRATGLDVVADTTDANGMARLRVKFGQYWLHARYDLPYTELYWNVPIDIQRGERLEIRLDRAKAEERIKL